MFSLSLTTILLLLMIQSGCHATELQQQRHVDGLSRRVATLETLGGELRAIKASNRRLEARVQYLLQRDVAVKHNTSDNSIISTGNGTDKQNEDKTRHRRETSNDVNTDTVAFYALLTHTLSKVAVEQGIIFDNDVTNIGGCYNKLTGIFTCCKSGLYLITWTILIASEHRIDTALKVNSTVMAKTRNDQGGGRVPSPETASRTLVIKLEKEDAVWVQVSSLGVMSISGDINAGMVTSFSGFLIQSM